MSLRRVVEDLLGRADADPGALAPGSGDAETALDASGHGELDPALFADALVHYADTAPIEVADALAPLVVEASPVPLDPELDPVTPVTPLTELGEADGLDDPSDLDAPDEPLDEPGEMLDAHGEPLDEPDEPLDAHGKMLDDGEMPDPNEGDHADPPGLRGGRDGDEFGVGASHGDPHDATEGDAADAEQPPVPIGPHDDPPEAADSTLLVDSVAEVEQLADTFASNPLDVDVDDGEDDDPDLLLDD